ncbi:MAG: hypothetical protein F2789_04240 [Actinobacteria bacterium]|nr:hypothetical protein [Actinomycetota bacterium]
MAHAPHRLLGGHNPFVATAIFATSGGANLAYNATATLLGLLMWPVTSVAGPIAALNMLTVLTPVTGTLAARRLLHVLTGRSGAAATLGAFVIGFSPFVLMHNGGRFQLAFQAIVLLLLAEAIIVARSYARGQGLPRGRTLALGVLGGVQLWIGTEQLIIALLVGLLAGAGVLAAWSADGPTRQRVPRAKRRDGATLGLAALGAVVVAAPFLTALLFGAERYGGGYHQSARSLFGLRLSNAFTATEATLIRSPLPLAVDRSSLSPFYAEDIGYLSVIGIAILMLVGVTWRRRSRLQRGALVVALGCWVLALGPTMRWSGMRWGVPGPWRLMELIPVLQEIIANRMFWGTFVCLGVIIAEVGSANRGTSDRPLRWACWALALLLFPAQYTQTRSVSAAADTLVRQQCHGELAVTLPQALEHEGMALQARTDFAFDMYRGFAFRSSSLPKGDRLGIDDVAERGTAANSASTIAIDELRSAGIGCVIVPASSLGTIEHLAMVLGAPMVAGDVAVWPHP